MVECNVGTGSEIKRRHSDDLYDEARRVIRSTTLPSVSFVQRKLHIDFDRAASLLREIEEESLTGVPKVQD